MKRNYLKFLVVVALILLIGTLVGDEAVTSIEKAKSLYKSGNYSQAVNELNYAINQIRQVQLEEYKTVFPSTLKGWKANEFSSDNGAMSLMGGGLSISRYFEKEAADENGNYANIDISVVSESPLISSLLMMFNNPIFLGDNKMVTVKGEKAIESKDSNGIPNELQFVIENRVVITVDANNATWEDLYNYAENIDFSKLKSILSK